MNNNNVPKYAISFNVYCDNGERVEEIGGAEDCEDISFIGNNIDSLIQKTKRVFDTPDMMTYTTDNDFVGSFTKFGKVIGVIVDDNETIEAVMIENPEFDQPEWVE